jgi:endonuclease III
MKLMNRTAHPRLAENAPSHVIRILARRYTDPGMVASMGNAKDALLSALLSARTTDAQVIKMYPAFRTAFPTFASLARATVPQIASKINTIGLYRSKARYIRALARLIQRDHEGRVPRTRDALMALPGVGRKTANCVLSYVYGIPAICVDTHVFRIAHRLGWSRGRTPTLVEHDLMRIVPQRYWIEVNRSFIQFGREICKPGKPQCWRCPVAKWCAYQKKEEG